MNDNHWGLHPGYCYIIIKDALLAFQKDKQFLVLIEQKLAVSDLQDKHGFPSPALKVFLSVPFLSDPYSFFPQF